MAAPTPASMHRLAKGQTWKDVKTGQTFTIEKDGCGPQKDFICLWGPKLGLGHVACPCCYDPVKGERCYYAWVPPPCIGGLGVVVWGDGTKMHTQFCGIHTHFELVEPTVVGGGNQA